MIGSSTDTHADLITRAAAAGKAIFCEKPVDLAVDRARAAPTQSSVRACVCMIGFQRRYDPTFSALKERLVKGEIGEPEMLVVTSRDPGAPPVEYLKRSGGIFRDMLIHDFDIFRWILDDDAATVYATGSVLTDPAVGTRRRRRLHGGRRSARRRAGSRRSTPAAAPRTATTSASRCWAARACCRRATTSRPK